ncbi:MAG: response regulator [Myxococcota bacterium]|nr:response regulator [Myxococcota bacterium]
MVWIVDDSPTEAAITQRSLGGGYEFETFNDGSIVVERLSTTPQEPDLLLLDWVMPGMQGDEVCRFLRSRPQTRDLPIIMVTASRIETQDVVEGLANGANDYVARPFAPEELRARVDAALRAKHLTDAAAREAQRLATVNRLGHALFKIGTSVEKIIDELAQTLTVTLCDGCSILILPGPLPSVAVSRHRHDASGAALARIASVADPVVHSFASAERAKRLLPPAYAAYIDRFGLRGLAILPFPIREPVRGVVTVTREGNAQPFDAQDIATIETCIEYAGLAIDSAMRFDHERLARAQLDTVLANLPIGILATDEHGVLSLVNAAARSLIPRITDAYTLPDIFGGAEWAASDGSSLGETGWVSAAPQTQLPVSAELLLQLPGEELPRNVAVSAVPLRDGGHSITGTVTIVQDVSAERAVSAERERIAHFQEEMLGIVGHDLRNPLGAVIAGTELLHVQSEQAAPTLRPTIRRIQASAHRMTRIIEQLLDVTRARLGSGIPIAPRDTSLLPIIKGVIEELGLAYPKTTFQLLPTEDVHGFWDPDRLAQVVSNLMSNAAQYGLPGAPVCVELLHIPQAAVITVRNEISEAPIDPDMIGLLFAPYRRGKNKGHHTGLGLGLYIVHEIVRAHGGAIDVESSQAGTIFRVTLALTPSGDRVLHP